jgi:protein-tyrosine phosphatase
MAPPDRIEFRHPEGPAQRLAVLLRRNFGGFKGLLRLLLTNADYLLGPAVKFTRPDLSRVDRLVFVCLANLKRSAFAQAVAQQAGLPAASFGLCAVNGQTPLPMAVRMAAELGYRLDGHHSTDLPLFEPAAGDLYLVMELRHAYHLVRQGFPAERVALLGYWSRPQRLHLQDPHRKGQAYLRTCFTLIQSAVLNVGRELKAAQGARLQPAPAAAPSHPVA